MNPLVSILIPAFNAEAWIADTLRSAIAQTWSPKEIIVVDDASTDRTLDVVGQFVPKSVRVVKQSHKGAAAARNAAFSLSEGSYIQWLDADDLLAPEKISRQMDTLVQSRSRQTLASSTWGRFRYRHYRAEFVPTALWRDLSPTEFLLLKMQHNVTMQTATWLVSRELAEAAGQWDTNLLSDDDGEYFCRVLLGSDGVRFVPDAKVYYRFFGYDTLGYIGRSHAKLEAQWRSMQLHVNYLLALEDSERARCACISYLQSWLVHFAAETPDIATEMRELAAKLGGQLQAPRLGWKYSWMEGLTGTKRTRSVQLSLRNVKQSLQKSLDRALFSFENSGLAGKARS